MNDVDKHQVANKYKHINLLLPLVFLAALEEHNEITTAGAHLLLSLARDKLTYHFSSNFQNILL